MATPQEVVAYWNYQRWRVLENWLYVIGQLPFDDQAEPNQKADEFVKTTFANAKLADVSTLPKAISSAENPLPSEHDYRRLIALERQR